MSSAFFDDSKEFAREAEGEAPTIVYRPAVSPGKVALTARLAGSAPADAATHERSQPRAASDARPAQRATTARSALQRMTAQEMDVAMRPDLHDPADADAPIQRKQSGDGERDATLSEPAGSGGAHLPDDVRSQMEAAFDADFSAVRIHEDDRAGAVGAVAFTRGADIHFAPGQYDPHGTRGRELLGHELTHVVQQAEGRVATTTQAAGVPVNDDASLEREADEMGARVARGAAASRPAAEAHDAGRALSRSLAARSVAQRRTSPSAGAGRTIQRRRSNGVSVSGMRFAPPKIKDDGATTSQATVSYSNSRMAGPAALNWSIEGAAFGAAVDASGLITPGTNTVPAAQDKVKLTVKAVDSKEAGAFTTGNLWMWNQKVVQAKADLETLRGLTPTVNNFRARSVGPAAAGKFDATYAVRRRRLTAEVRIQFNFVNDGATPWTDRSKRGYIRDMIRRVNRAWSGQWTFNVVREPKRVWQGLGPVSVTVRAKEDAGAPHFVMAVHKAPVSPSFVNQNTTTGKIDADDARTQNNPFPNTKAAELAALQAQIPTPILFAQNKADVPAADQNKLQFLARYMHAIRNPSFELTITGHAQKDAAAVTPAQQRTAARAARTLSRQRAQNVRDLLRGHDLRAHRVRTSSVGDTGAASAPAWDKVELASAVSAGYRNRYNIQNHEFGHMLGLRDEYPGGARVAGSNTQHYGLVKDALGQDYADAFAKVQNDSEGIMNGGTDVRPHHYVTFWQALAQITKAQAAPVPPLDEPDWKFVGV